MPANKMLSIIFLYLSVISILNGNYLISAYQFVIAVSTWENELLRRRIDDLKERSVR